MYDVIIVGARCAGSTLAMLLAREKHRVLLVDKAEFPSDTTSTHLIWQAGLARARSWGLLERIAGLGAPPIRNARFDVGELEFAGTPPPLDSIDYFVAPRRTVLDKMLLDTAVEAGAEVRERFYVRSLLTEDGRVTGIQGGASRGAAAETARIVVGADGVHSFVAGSVKAAKFNERPSASCIHYAYWRGGPRVSEFVTYVRPYYAGAMWPTNDDLTCIVGTWTDAFAGPKVRPEEGYRKFMQGIPRFTEFLKSGEQVEPVAGMRETPGFFRKAWGDGWALAGDARYHKHPLSAQGITDAFSDAEMLAQAIHAGLSGRRDISDALADYERTRNEAVMPMYESTCARAKLEPFPPEAMALFRALRHNQEEADRFFGTDAGTFPIGEFFAPENVARIVRSAPSAAGA